MWCGGGFEKGTLEIVEGLLIYMIVCLYFSRGWVFCARDARN